MGEWLLFCKNSGLINYCEVSVDECRTAFMKANKGASADGDSHEMNLEEFSQALIYIVCVSGMCGQNVDMRRLPLASHPPPQVITAVTMLLGQLTVKIPKSSIPQARSVASGGGGKPSKDGDNSDPRNAIWNTIPRLRELFEIIAQSHGIVGKKSKSISMGEWLMWLRNFNVIKIFNLTKEDAINAFNGANKGERSDKDKTEMNFEEFCQCLIYLSTIAGLAGPQDVQNLPLARECSLSISVAVNNMLTQVRC